MIRKLIGLNTRFLELACRGLAAMPGFARNAAIRIAVKSSENMVAAADHPTRIVWFVTNRCDARCAHCFYHSSINRNDIEELTKSELIQVMHSFTKPLDVVTLTGGEPTTREDLPDICAALHDICNVKKIAIVTNGLEPGRVIDCVRNITERVNVNLHLNVSIDGLEDDHDRIRGVRGSFANAVETVSRLKEISRITRRLNRVAVQTVIWHNDTDKLSQLVDFVDKELQAPQQFQWLRDDRNLHLPFESEALAIHRPAQEWPGSMSIDDMEKIYEMLKGRMSARKNVSIMDKRDMAILYYGIEAMKGSRLPFKCLAGTTDCVIYPDGQVGVCEMVAPFLSLKETGFSFPTVWKTGAAESLKRIVPRCSCPHPCAISSAMLADAEACKAIFSKTLPCP